MKSWKYLVGTVAVMFAAGIYAVPSMASSISCSPATVNFKLGDASDAECFSNVKNDTNNIDSNFEMFNRTGWVLADKSGDDTSGDGAITFTDAPTDGETSTAGWEISGLPSGLEFGDIVVTLKQANDFAAFLVSDTSGTWSTWKEKNGKNTALNGLSHASIYYFEPHSLEGEVLSTPVPGPTSTSLFLLALALLGTGAFLRFRRS